MAEFRRDSSGLAGILKSSDVAGAVHRQAEQVAAQARAQGRSVASGAALPVTVDDYTTDRAASAVTITHPAGTAMQAKYGVLTRAAAALGLEVSS